MADIMLVFEAPGAIAVFFWVLAEQFGAPVPALPMLMMAGARGATDGVFALQALGAATLASLIADAAWFLAGRRYGRSVLGLLCRVSISPGTCVQKSELSFARRGLLTVLFAKFVPGVSTIAPPMAGALRMPLATFLLLDLAGTVLWAGSGVAAGLLFHDQVLRVTQQLQGLGSAALVVVGALLALYVAWRLARRVLAHRGFRAARRITPRELAASIDAREGLLLLDVRSPELEPAGRLPGAVPTPLERIRSGTLPPIDRKLRLVTYCDCPNDASAAHAALTLARQGYDVRVLAGGFGAWAAAGLPVETGRAPAALLEEAAPAAQPGEDALAPAFAVGAGS